jgi:intracellular multiplication protein IcmJ
MSADLEVINADNDYSNNVESNLISACALCTRCTLLDAYGLDYAGNDRVIYMPELSQEQLNHLCQVLFCQLQLGGDAAYNAKMLLAQLQDRADWLDHQASCKLSHPALFVQYMQSEKRDLALVNKLRLLPDAEGYQEHAKAWLQSLQDELMNEHTV